MGEGAGSIHSGQASDKTADIAVSYAEKVDRLNFKHKQELETDLRSANMEMLRLEYYISLLDVKHSTILRMLYIDGLTYAKASEENKISPVAIKKLRTTGIRKLAAMFKAIVN